MGSWATGVYTLSVAMWATSIPKKCCGPIKPMVPSLVQRSVGLSGRGLGLVVPGVWGLQ